MSYNTKKRKRKTFTIAMLGASSKIEFDYRKYEMMAKNQPACQPDFIGWRERGLYLVRTSLFSTF